MNIVIKVYLSITVTVALYERVEGGIAHTYTCTRTSHIQTHSVPPIVRFVVNGITIDHFNNNNNKSAQSNLGGPRRGAVAYVCRKVPIGYNCAPQIRPQNSSSCGPIPKPHYVSHSWTRPTYDAKRHPDPIRRFSTMHWTDRPTDARTDRQTDRSSTGKFDDYATRATRPNNIHMCIAPFVVTS